MFDIENLRKAQAQGGFSGSRETIDPNAICFLNLLWRDMRLVCPVGDVRFFTSLVAAHDVLHEEDDASCALACFFYGLGHESAIRAGLLNVFGSAMSDKMVSKVIEAINQNRPRDYFEKAEAQISGSKNMERNHEYFGKRWKSDIFQR